MTKGEATERIASDLELLGISITPSAVRKHIRDGYDDAFVDKKRFLVLEKEIIVNT